MAVIFDTFRNAEVAHAHKDIAVVTNDGRGSATDKLEQELDGCSAKYRYHEGRDDFSVANISYAKVRPFGSEALALCSLAHGGRWLSQVTYKDGVLTVKVDEKGTGTWRTCTSVADLGLPADSLSGAYLGLSASTGQLADNHDVLSVKMYSCVGLQWRAVG